MWKCLPPVMANTQPDLEERLAVPFSQTMSRTARRCSEHVASWVRVCYVEEVGPLGAVARAISMLVKSKSLRSSRKSLKDLTVSISRGWIADDPCVTKSGKRKACIAWLKIGIVR